MFQLGKKTEEDKAKRAAEKEARKAEKAEKKEEREKKVKAEKAEKAARKDKHTPSEAGDAREATSPNDSRMSRDTYSIISTADVSEASPRESLERSISHTASDAAGSIGKESFMQKLTRKGSTNQFLTFGKKNALFSKSSKAGDVPGTPDEAEEESSGGFFGLGRSTESVGNSPSIGTPKDKASVWGSIKRIGKKDKTPSLHESIASEATGDEEDVFAEGTRA
jgi:hypothetical protein